MIELNRNKSFLSKKLLGIPILGFLILGIAGVLATGIYFAFFTTTVHSVKQIYINGSLVPIINCNPGESCLGDLIKITNNGANAYQLGIVVPMLYENCSIEVLGAIKVNSTYYTLTIPSQALNNTRDIRLNVSIDRYAPDAEYPISLIVN